MFGPNWSSRPVNGPNSVGDVALEPTSPISKLDAVTAVEVLSNVENEVLFSIVDVVQIIVESLGYIVRIGILHGT